MAPWAPPVVALGAVPAGPASRPWGRARAAAAPAPAAAAGALAAPSQAPCIDGGQEELGDRLVPRLPQVGALHVEPGLAWRDAEFDLVGARRPRRRLQRWHHARQRGQRQRPLAVGGVEYHA